MEVANDIRNKWMKGLYSSLYIFLIYSEFKFLTFQLPPILFTFERVVCTLTVICVNSVNVNVSCGRSLYFDSTVSGHKSGVHKGVPLCLGLYM